MENAAQTGSSDRRGRANESAISRFLAGAYLVFFSRFVPFRSNWSTIAKHELNLNNRPVNDSFLRIDLICHEIQSFYLASNKLARIILNTLIFLKTAFSFRIVEKYLVWNDLSAP